MLSPVIFLSRGPARSACCTCSSSSNTTAADSSMMSGANCSPVRLFGSSIGGPFLRRDRSNDRAGFRSPQGGFLLFEKVEHEAGHVRSLVHDLAALDRVVAGSFDAHGAHGIQNALFMRAAECSWFR